jgi:hypothetical protein
MPNKVILLMAYFSEPFLITSGVYTVKKSFSIFPSSAGMSLTKLFLGGNRDVIYKLFPPIGRVW